MFGLVNVFLFNQVCLEKLNDIQLALVISRLYESEFEVSSTYKSVLQKRILGSVFPAKESSGNMHCDPFLRSMAYWILEDYSKALDTLIKHSVEDGGKNMSILPVRLVLTTCSFKQQFLKVQVLLLTIASKQLAVARSVFFIVNVVPVVVLSCIP